MAWRRVILGVSGMSFVFAIVLTAGTAAHGPLDPTLWGAGTADAPYCHQFTWTGQPVC